MLPVTCYKCTLHLRQCRTLNWNTTFQCEWIMQSAIILQCHEHFSKTNTNNYIKRIIMLIKASIWYRVPLGDISPHISYLLFMIHLHDCQWKWQKYQKTWLWNHKAFYFKVIFVKRNPTEYRSIILIDILQTRAVVCACLLYLSLVSLYRIAWNASQSWLPLSEYIPAESWGGLSGWQ